MSDLLILACSARKTDASNPIPAIERYDGPVYRMLRRYLRNVNSSETPHIYILSARFGLVDASYPVPLYDEKLTKSHIAVLSPLLGPQIEKLNTIQVPQRIFIGLPKLYKDALGDLTRIFPECRDIEISPASHGQLLSRLHDWLYGHPPIPTTGNKGKTTIRGIEPQFTRQQIIDLARVRLNDDHLQSGKFHAWYVLIDSRPVGVKWLVSQFTGLSVSQFTSTEACRILQQLNIEVLRQ